MSDSPILHATQCAICHTENNAAELYPANFDMSAFNDTVFSARRLPDGVHYRLVRCAQCGLVRSDPVIDPDTLYRLYERSTFTYQDEVDDLRYTYGRYLARVRESGGKTGRLLEIGAGNGFFLEAALEQGYREVVGVEPSTHAIEQAAANIRPFLVADMFRSGLFPEGTFDTVCMFQVFDHLVDPGEVLDVCLNVLKPGGYLLLYNHNVDALSSKLLGERSPIIDIEHTYLYNFATISRILQDHQFKVVEVGAAYNRYKLKYLSQLFPFPRPVKPLVMGILDRTGLSRMKVSVPLGNLYAIARKADE